MDISPLISNWQRFSSILWAVSWVWWLFLLLCKSSLVWCSPFCSLFLLDAEAWVLFRETFLLLCVPVYFLLLPGVICFLWDRNLQTFALGWLQTLILLISAFWVARITGFLHFLKAQRIIYRLKKNFTYYGCFAGDRVCVSLHVILPAYLFLTKSQN
jgi:hypothetical protein